MNERAAKLLRAELVGRRWQDRQNGEKMPANCLWMARSAEPHHTTDDLHAACAEDLYRAVAAVSGIVALSKRSAADCGGNLCAGDSVTYSGAQNAANVATVAVIAGGIGVGAGAVLLLLGRTETPPRKASFRIVPQLSTRGGSIGVVVPF